MLTPRRYAAIRCCSGALWRTILYFISRVDDGDIDCWGGFWRPVILTWACPVWTLRIRINEVWESRGNRLIWVYLENGRQKGACVCVRACVCVCVYVCVLCLHAGYVWVDVDCYVYTATSRKSWTGDCVTSRTISSTAFTRTSVVHFSRIINSYFPSFSARNCSCEYRLSRSFSSDNGVFTLLCCIEPTKMALYYTSRFVSYFD